MNLESIFKSLGLPMGIVAVIVAVLGAFGLSADEITAVSITLVGVQLCVSLFIDVLKYAGVVNDGDAGKWSAAINLIIFCAVALQLRFIPAFDVAGLDAQLMNFAKIAGLVFIYVTQITGTKQAHYLFAHTVGIKAFSHSA